MENYNYGVIGNCTSAALVSDTGDIVWSCLPAFNSPSVFASILDENKGGYFKILVDESYSISQRYLNKTNILITEYSNGVDCFELIDFMPRYKFGDEKYYAPPDFARYIKLISGTPKFRVDYKPRLEYAKPNMQSDIYLDYIKSYTTEGAYNSIYLYSNFDNHDIISGKELTVCSNSFFLIAYDQKLLCQSTSHVYLLLQRTKTYWLNWSDATKKYSEFNKEILRSALTLKLLSYQKTGAVLAALTTSLPESIGEVRNWDYRFCWIRDASMIVRVLVDLGHLKVTKNFMNFIINIIPLKAEKMQIMYGIDYKKKLKESILDHLSGYENSKPVRIGNAAYRQKQHDIFGILMDVIYSQFTIFESSIERSENMWTITKGIVHRVERNWKTTDRGIWELRSNPKHFTISKILCWVAVDRAIKIANYLDRYEFITAWEVLAEKIRADIMKKAWNEKLGAFTQYYGSERMDASNLLMETYGFIEKDDPKFVSTVQATYKELCHEDLMYRYISEDDFGKPSSSFTICSFWMVNSLYKIGERKKARYMFKKLLSYSNHLGLFGEDIDFNSKRQLGNFPQAYSHLALIQTAITISGGETSECELRKERF